MTTLKHNIQQLFRASGMSQRDFAAKYGISPKVAWTYINGTAKPNGRFVLKLCEEHSVDFEFLNNTKVKINAKGEITNRPDYRARAARIRKDMEQLITEKQKADTEFLKAIRKLAVDLESIAARKK